MTILQAADRPFEWAGRDSRKPAGESGIRGL